MRSALSDAITHARPEEVLHMLRVEDGYRMTRHGAMRRRKRTRRRPVLAVICVLASISVVFWAVSEVRHARSESDAIAREVLRLTEELKKTRSEADGLRQRVLEAEADATLLEEEVRDARERFERASALAAALEREVELWRSRAVHDPRIKR